MQVFILSRKIYFGLFIVRLNLKIIILVFVRESREIEGLKMSFGTILTMAGGLGLFLFGMELMSDSIEKVAGARLRRILEILPRTVSWG